MRDTRSSYEYWNSQQNEQYAGVLVFKTKQNKTTRGSVFIYFLIGFVFSCFIMQTLSDQCGVVDINESKISKFVMVSNNNAILIFGFAFIHYAML